MRDDSDNLDDKHDGLEEDNKSNKRLKTSKANAGSEASQPVRDEKRMEINRIRAKEIRKRKKEMEEDMHNQIIHLTLENNKLRTQLQLQEAEIKLLRNNMQLLQQNHHQQALYVPVPGLGASDFGNNALGRGSLNSILGSSSGLLPSASTPGSNFFLPNQASSLAGFDTLPNAAGGLLSNFNGLAPMASSSTPEAAGMDGSNHFDPNVMNGAGSEARNVGATTSDAESDHQKQLMELLSRSSSHVKKSLMEKLSNERKRGL